MSDQKEETQDLSAHSERLSEIWSDLAENKYALTESGITSLKRFLTYLPPQDVYEAMIVASEKITDLERIEERFKYFCGICWSAIKGGQINNTNKAIKSGGER